MAQKNRAVSRMFFLILMLTLISCCFLGSTFARYVTTDDASAKFDVASWKVSHAEGDTVTAFDSLSPSMKDFTATTPGEDATNSTAKKLVATITNDGDVNALVSLSSAFDTITKVAGAAEDPTYDDAAIQGLFTITLTHGTTNSADTDTTATLDNIALGVGETIYVWASVTWTTNYSDSKDKGVTEDKLDTWVGQNVESVSFKISYKAVQSSQLPAGN